MKTFETTIIVTADDAAVAGADVALLASDGTYRAGKTDAAGSAKLTVPADDEQRTVLVAHAGYEGYHSTTQLEPGVRELTIRVRTTGGSAIFLNGSGQVPGLDGRLNPIKDTLKRTYIYGENISFDERSEQPHPFQEGEPFVATDSLRNRYRICVPVIVGRTSLIDYERID